MNKKCRYCLGQGYQYDVANDATAPCPYCSHTRIEDIKVESPKQKTLAEECVMKPKTLRDEFAIATFTVLLANPALVSIGTNPWEAAYSYADEMMKEREK